MQIFTAVALLCGVLLFIGLPETTVAFSEPVPMDNMTLEKCGGSCPQKSCDNRDVDETVCTKDCVEGYRCNSGYIRRSVPNGPCVLPANCPTM